MWYVDNVDENFHPHPHIPHMRIIHMNRIFRIRMANPILDVLDRSKGYVDTHWSHLWKRKTIPDYSLWTLRQVIRVLGKKVTYRKERKELLPKLGGKCDQTCHRNLVTNFCTRSPHSVYVDHNFKSRRKKTHYISGISLLLSVIWNKAKLQVLQHIHLSLTLFSIGPKSPCWPRFWVKF